MQMIHEIYPRRYRGHWLFDDPRHNIVDEEFVCGMDTILDIMCAKKRQLSRGVRLLFSNQEIPGSMRLDWRREDAGGDWYIANKIQITGWCCPTLRKYFPEGAPKELYLKISFLKGDESWESLLSSQRSAER
jgi:hypothetical protein